jgi:hypothetical protein
MPRSLCLCLCQSLPTEHRSLTGPGNSQPPLPKPMSHHWLHRASSRIGGHWFGQGEERIKGVDVRDRLASLCFSRPH